MKNDDIIEKLIYKTKNKMLKWKNVEEIPKCIPLNPYKVTKIFSTDINANLEFYIIEYSYTCYNPDTDSNYLDYSIKGSFIQENIEVSTFDRSDLIMPYKMDNLIELVVEQIFNIKQQINDLLNDN